MQIMIWDIDASFENKYYLKDLTAKLHRHVVSILERKKMTEEKSISCFYLRE